MSQLDAAGQSKEEEKQPRILILLDGSSSMGNNWSNNETRFKAASRIITTLIDSLYKVNKDVEFALRVYGHQSPSQHNNCYDTKLEVMFSKDNLTQMYLRLAALRAVGVSPIAFSLKEAAENDLTDQDRNTYSLILITDGEESCGGNICDVVSKLLQKKIDFKPYILSLVDNAALKSQYDCLGNYLLVSGEKDIKPTVGKIVDAYKPMLTLTNVQRKLISTAVVNAPSVLKVSIPKFEVKKEVEVTEPAYTPPPVPKPAPQPKIDRPETKLAEVKEAKPSLDLTDRTTDISIALSTEQIDPIQVNRMARLLRVFYATPVFRMQVIPPYNPPPIKQEPMPQIAMSTPKQTTVASVAPPKAEPKPVPEMPAPKPAPVVSAPAPKPQPKPAPKKSKENIQPVELTKPRELKYTQTNIEAKETTLQVYFTDGKNTEYHTTPEVVLVDPKTKKPLHRFYRTINEKGVPDMQKIPPGIYSLTITGKNNYIVPDIKVEANKNNGISIPVSEGSILFAYAKNPSRPVEYIATVHHRFSNDPPVKQKCTQELFYQPGTYHVEINTLPPHKRTFDLNFGEQYEILLQEEGQLIITNTNYVGKVTLYYPFGDQFRIFYTMNIEGSGGGVRLDLLPGTYKAGFKKSPDADQTVIEFAITSNNVTNLELK